MSTPLFPQVRERLRKRVEEAKARVERLREGGSKSQIVRELREKGVLETIRARREKRLAKPSRGTEAASGTAGSPTMASPEPESPVIEKPRVKTYTAPIRTY